MHDDVFLYLIYIFIFSYYIYYYKDIHTNKCIKLYIRPCENINRFISEAAASIILFLIKASRCCSAGCSCAALRCNSEDKAHFIPGVDCKTPISYFLILHLKKKKKWRRERRLKCSNTVSLHSLEQLFFVARHIILPFKCILCQRCSHQAEHLSCSLQWERFWNRITFRQRK